MERSPLTMTAADWATVLGLAVIWGGAFFFIELGLRGFAPLTLVCARLALAAVALWIALRASGGRLPRGRGVWAGLLLLGLLNNVMPLTLFTWSQTRIDSGLASILNATVPIWGVLAAHLLTHDDRATPQRVAGVALGFAGVVLMIGWDALAGFGANIVPQLACLVAALFYALAGVWGRHLGLQGIGPLAIATGSIALAALMMLPFALVVDQPWNAAAPGAVSVIALVALALGSTALGYALFFRLLASAGATNSMLVTFLIPVTAVLLGWLALGERLAPQHFAGMGLIALALVALDGRAWRRLRGAAPAP